MQHLEASGQRALHYLQRQRLSLQVGHQRLDAELDEQRDDEHRDDQQQRRVAHRRLAGYRQPVQQQIRPANYPDVAQRHEHLPGQHASELFVRLRVEEGRHGQIADGPQSAYPQGGGQDCEVAWDVFQWMTVS